MSACQENESNHQTVDSLQLFVMEVANFCVGWKTLKDFV